MSQTLEQIDPNFAIKDSDADVLWYDALALGLEGRGWDDVQRPYDRLPAKAEGVVRDPVWVLSRDSAGMLVRFVTDTPTLAVRWQLRSEALQKPHMSATGVSGVDAYVLIDNVWRRIGGNNAGSKFPENSRTLVDNVSSEARQYLLYLPLYNGVEKVEVGIAPGSTLHRAPAWPCKDQRPVCFYGTSIVQGGCASRPSMAYPAILGRRFQCPTINLGFSGNARSEPEMAQLLAELDPSVYVIDPLPNMSIEIMERLDPLVGVLRQAHPQTPIVLVECITREFVLKDDVRKQTQEKNAVMRSVYEERTRQGDKNLYYVRGEALLGDDGEGTVDGTHPTDLGFMRMADAIGAVLGPLVS